ncbi:MAG: hypothetical protein GSR86_01825 [Desulfurococcales archaeon]|nr:hypothetical protein [Desulfurococcales archaeon]
MIVDRRAPILVIAFYLIFMVLGLVLTLGYSPHEAIVYNFNGDVIYHDGDATILSNSTYTVVIEGNRSLGIGIGIDDGCRTRWGITLLGKDSSIITIIGDRAVKYDMPGILPEPRHLACSNDTAYAWGGDIIRGAMLYTISSEGVRGYPLYGASPGIEDLGMADEGVLVLYDSQLLIIDTGKRVYEVYNLSYSGWRIDLDLIDHYSGGTILLGSIRKDPSRLAAFIYYPNMDGRSVEVVGKASIAAAYNIIDGRELLLVRPAGEWATLVEWRRDKGNSISIAMGDAFTLTGSGALDEGIWLGGRLLGEMKAIVYTGGSASPGIVGEGYRVVVNLEKSKNRILVGSIHVNMTWIGSGDMGDPIHVEGSNLSLEETSVDSRIYGVYRDRVEVLLALFSISIPAGLGIYVVLTSSRPYR